MGVLIKSHAESSTWAFALHAVGLIFIYSMYGVLQEKIMKGTYADNERFTSSSVLVLCNRLFSSTTGIFLLFAAGKRNIKPASPIVAYAAVAALNFVSTFCQYEALKYVGFTTQALSKCAKMIPVLIVGKIVYSKAYKTREWAAGAVVMLGCATYSLSRPTSIVAHGKHEPVSSLFGTVMGTVLIMGYLFLDGLTSTTQERIFGKSDSGNPFAADSPVLDQMIWVNFFAALISILGSCASYGSTLPSISLMMRSPGLVADILMLSATAALGLILLLNTIAVFGALSSSMVMTCRQFLSIILNAGIFGNFAAIGTAGWTGVGWVASGVWIKMDRRFDAPKPARGRLGKPLDEEALINEKSGSPIDLEPREILIEAPTRTSYRQLFKQYGIPLLVPLVLAFAIQVAGHAHGTSQMHLSNAVKSSSPLVAMGSSRSAGTSMDLTENSMRLVDPGHSSSFASTASPVPVPDADLLTHITDLPGSDVPSVSELDDDDLNVDGQAAAINVEESSVSSSSQPPIESLPNNEQEIEGGPYAHQISHAVAAKCDSGRTKAIPLRDPKFPRTALATYPRSGNTYVRGLVERATGYQTSSLYYCDKVLAKTFAGECDHDARFLVKTHYPAISRDDTDEKHWQRFDRALIIHRNPLDSILSYWHERETFSHTDRVEGVKQLTLRKERVDIEQMVKRYLDHWTYWKHAPLQVHQVRYEDLRENPMPELMSMMTFLLPQEQLPSLERLTCALEVDEDKGAYQSRKVPAFDSWNNFDPETRQYIVEKLKEPWCSEGYDKLLKSTLGETLIDCHNLSPFT